MQIYLARNQVQAGPYTLEQVNDMLATRQVELDDLIWHEGLTQWQRVGTLTYGNYYYDPNGGSHDGSKVTVAQLYGKAEPESSASDSFVHHPVQTPLKPADNRRLDHPSSEAIAAQAPLAGILTRLLAVIINFILFSLCLIPMSSSLEPEQVYALYDTSLSQSEVMMDLVQVVPQQFLILSAIMTLALLIVQLALLAKKGQSIGKLATGIRIVDARSHKLPSPTTTLLRTILTSFVYYLTPFGLIAMLIDLIIMGTDKQKRSLHDKLAKTHVVKAKPNQIK